MAGGLKAAVVSALTDGWYTGAPWLHLLRPLAALFRGISVIRRRRLSALQQPFAVPVIVIGNISVGGTGKTPVVLALAEALHNSGRRVGVISRGYGGKARRYPLWVNDSTDVRESGDEACMMRRTLRGPLVLDPDRSRALRAVTTQSDCDVVISDDGLQHYRLWRDIEVVVVDAARGLGNRWCLPAGPLREPPQRLEEVDYILLNGLPALQQSEQSRLPDISTPQAQFTLVPQVWVNVRTGQQVSLAHLPLALHTGDGSSDGGDEAPVVDAIAGIGHPQRFFDSVQQLGFRVRPRAFADHHVYSAADLAFARHSVLLMTEKDAVKCQRFAGDNWWYLSVKAVLPAEFLQVVMGKLAAADTQ
jgi:tetraacyldisaccharide 4'-kinase